MNHCTCPLLLLSLFVWHAQRFIRAVDPNPFDLFVHILTAWVSWGWGQKGPKRLCHISCSSKLRAGAKRFWGVIGHVLKGGQPPTLPPQPFVENSFVTGIYTYQARFILNYRQIDNIYISMCFKFIIFELQVFIHIPYMYCLNCS